MATVNIPDELYAELEQRIKEAKAEMTVEELVQVSIDNYLLLLDGNEEDPERLAELLEAEAEADAEEAAGIGYSAEEVFKEIQERLIAKYGNNKASA